MGGPSKPKPTAAQKALEMEQQRQLSELTEEENRRVKALQRGRLGMRQLLGPMGILGTDATLGGMPPTMKPPGAPDSGFRPPPPPGKGPRGPRTRRSLIGYGGSGPGGVGGGVQRMAK